jgi:hypothetical protein
VRRLPRRNAAREQPPRHTMHETRHKADEASLGAASASLPPAIGRGNCGGAAGGGRGARQLQHHRMTLLLRCFRMLLGAFHRQHAAARLRISRRVVPSARLRRAAAHSMAAPQEGGGRGKRGIALGSARGGSMAPASSGCERLQSAASRAAR